MTPHTHAALLTKAAKGTPSAWLASPGRLFPFLASPRTMVLEVTPDRSRLLFVDDSPLQVQMFRRALEGSDYDIVTVTNIEAAVFAAQQKGFDFAIVDYLLGDERGDACVRALRPYALPHTKHFLYTTDSSAFRRYRDLGFDGVLMLKGKASVRSQVDTIARSISRIRSSAF